MSINIYCDESGHMEKDNVPVMVLGAVWSPKDKTREISKRIREIKKTHGVSPNRELKWTKISEGEKDLYLSILDYFFDDDDLHFRALVIPDKSRLDHTRFNQDHDAWYYKMYFELLRAIIVPNTENYIFLDLKDTKGSIKIQKLHDVLCNSMYDFNRDIIKNIQLVRSHEVEQVQLADLLIGAVSYYNRHLSGNHAKLEFIRRFQERSHLALNRSTLLMEKKTNIFIWSPS